MSSKPPQHSKPPAGKKAGPAKKAPTRPPTHPQPPKKKPTPPGTPAGFNMKPEQNLICSLLNILRVAPPHTVPHPFNPHAQWQGGQVVPFGDKPWDAYEIAQLEDAARRGGSFNHIALRLGCGVAAGEPGADAAAIAWLTEERDTLGLDGLEIGCGNDYWAMSRGADYVFVRFGPPSLIGLAFDRLDSYRFWAVSGAPIRGQRTAVGGREQRGFVDEWSDLISRRSAKLTLTPPTWDRMLIGALMPQVQVGMLRPLANPKTVVATPTTLYIGATKKMVIQEKEVDPNTRAVLISEEDEMAEREFAPAPPWGRQREAGDHAAVTVSNGVAHYHDTSGVFKDVDIAVPSDAKVYHLGSGSMAAEAVEA